jgi:hypothetical protein
VVTPSSRTGRPSSIYLPTVSSSDTGSCGKNSHVAVGDNFLNVGGLEGAVQVSGEAIITAAKKLMELAIGYDRKI